MQRRAMNAAKERSEATVALECLGAVVENLEKSPSAAAMNSARWSRQPWDHHQPLDSKLESRPIDPDHPLRRRQARQHAVVRECEYQQGHYTKNPAELFERGRRSSKYLPERRLFPTGWRGLAGNCPITNRENVTFRGWRFEVSRTKQIGARPAGTVLAWFFWIVEACRRRDTTKTEDRAIK